MMPYELFISLRYLRARRKQVFLSIITFISIAGIFLGVAALIIVIAVMNGFETDLRSKILGINSHVVVMEHGGGMRQHSLVMQEVARIPGVVAATPFIYSQAMLKNGNNVTGIVLRGLSLEDALKVINLGKIREGSLDYLKDGERSIPGLKPELADLPGILIGRELAQLGHQARGARAAEEEAEHAVTLGDRTQDRDHCRGALPTVTTSGVHGRDAFRVGLSEQVAVLRPEHGAVTVEMGAQDGPRANRQSTHGGPHFGGRVMAQRSATSAVLSQPLTSTAALRWRAA